MKERGDFLTVDMWGDDFGTEDAPESTVEQRFWAFHAANPAVYEAFDRFARREIARGRTKTAAHLLIQLVRWEAGIQTRGEKYKLTNDFFPYYARLWLRENPHHSGFFELRPLKIPASEQLTGVRQ